MFKKFITKSIAEEDQTGVDTKSLNSVSSTTESQDEKIVKL